VWFTTVCKWLFKFVRIAWVFESVFLFTYKRTYTFMYLGAESGL